MVRTAFARVPSVAGRVALVAASLFVAATADSYQLASDGSSYSVSGLATGTCRSYLLNIRPYSKSATIRVSPSSGDPDLYVSSQPLTCATKSSATWSSRSGAGSYDTVSLTSTQLASLDQLYVVVRARRVYSRASRHQCCFAVRARGRDARTHTPRFRTPRARCLGGPCAGVCVHVNVLHRELHRAAELCCSVCNAMGTHADALPCKWRAVQ